MSYLIDALVLKLRDELVETVVVGLNANGLEQGLDVSGRGGGVAAEAEEEVGCEVLHCGGGSGVVSSGQTFKKKKKFD